MADVEERFYVRMIGAPLRYWGAPGAGLTPCVYDAYPYTRAEAIHNGFNDKNHEFVKVEAYGKPAFQRAEDGEFLRDYTSEERKAAPVVTGVLHYFPDAIMAIARVSVAGNAKHNPGEPLHWSRGKSNDHINCEGRHLLTPDGIDADTGQTERANKAWRALADLQIAEEKRLVSIGIRPLSGVVK